MTPASPNSRLPGVAFIVTSYNKEVYLPFVLKSLLAQEGDFEREYIVVDDQSTDRSPEIAMDLVGRLPNGRVLRQSNAGPANAQDHGVRYATLPLLKFVDGDAALTPDCILRLLPAFETPGVAMVNGGGLEVPDISALPPIPRSAPARFRYLFDGLASAIRDSISSSSGALVRRDAYLACGGCDRHVFIHENSFVYRLAIRHGLAFTDDPVVVIPNHEVRVRAGNHLGEVAVQIEHDRNAALYGLVRDFPDLPLAIRRLAFRRAAGRAWKWARRVNGAHAGLDPSFWLNVLSYAPGLPNYPELLRRTMEPYRRTGGVRVPTPLAESDLSGKNGAGGGI